MRQPGASPPVGTVRGGDARERRQERPGSRSPRPPGSQAAAPAPEKWQTPRGFGPLLSGPSRLAFQPLLLCESWYPGMRGNPLAVRRVFKAGVRQPVAGQPR